MAGFLRFVEEENGRGMRGALFLVNARGEPADFAYSRIDVHASFLWRSGEATRHSAGSLSAALFEACPETPTLLLALAEEVPPKVFNDDILVDMPVCRVGVGLDAARGPDESVETSPSSSHLFWVGAPPHADSPARRLLDALIARQLITEPFERAAIGLEEAFREL